MNINEEQVVTKKEGSVWLGFVIGYLMNVIGLIIAIFWREKETRKGIIIGAVTGLISSTILALFIVYIFINSYNGPRIALPISLIFILF